jgi:hypothetical protein
MDLATGRSQFGAAFTSVAGGGGVVFYRTEGVVYFTQASASAVLRASITKDGLGPAIPIATILATRAVGAITADIARGRLLVGDGFVGVIHALPLDRARRQERLIKGVGSASSLSVSPDSSVLYVADAFGRAVWVVPLDGPNRNLPRKFVADDYLKEVTGVAVDEQSRVWVGVDGRNGVRVFDAKGVTLLRSFELASQQR